MTREKETRDEKPVPVKIHPP